MLLCRANVRAEARGRHLGQACSARTHAHTHTYTHTQSAPVRVHAAVHDAARVEQLRQVGVLAPLEADLALNDLRRTRVLNDKK